MIAAEKPLGCPEHSIATSTPSPSVSSRRNAGTSTDVGSSTTATPSASARARRAAFGSEMYTVDAPAERAQSAASAPIGPAPVTSTRSPGATAARSTPYAATAVGSISAPCR